MSGFVQYYYLLLFLSQDVPQQNTLKTINLLLKR